MPNDLSRTFLAVLEDLRPALRHVAFTRWVLVTVGWILTTDPTHSLAAALVAVGLAGGLPFQPFYAWFARGAWDPDALGLLLLRRLLRSLDGGPLRIVVDDTLNPHKGPHIFGLACHVDPVLSSRRHKVLRFGLNWVVLAVVVRVPFSSRWWALPILFRLYRGKKTCPPSDYLKKTELAHAMIQKVCAAVPDLFVVGTGDLGYCNGTVLRDRPANLIWVGTMRPDAALTGVPTAPRRKKGERLPTPQQVARLRSTPWQHLPAHVYGEDRVLHLKTWVAQWYAVCGATPLRLALVRTSGGAVPFRVFFCTETLLDPVTLVEVYASRWSIERFFEDARQWLGWGQSGQRVAAAVLRITPLVGWSYTVLVEWFAEGAWQHPLAQPPTRRWYPQKTDASFADIVRTARKVLAPVDWIAVTHAYEHRDRWAPPTPVPVQLALPLVA